MSAPRREIWNEFLWWFNTAEEFCFRCYSSICVLGQKVDIIAVSSHSWICGESLGIVRVLRWISCISGWGGIGGGHGESWRRSRWNQSTRRSANASWEMEIERNMQPY